MGLLAKRYLCLFNTLSSFVITFFPRTKHLLFSWLQLLAAVILQAKKKICHSFHCFTFYLTWSDGTGCYDIRFFSVGLQASFLTVFFTLMKMLFISSSLSATRVVSSAYVRLLVSSPVILIPYCNSSSRAFCMMNSTYKLNKQSENIQLCCTPVSILTSQFFHVLF